MINALTGDSFDADFRKLLRGIDALLAAAVINLTTSAPPGSPANGDAYIVKATGTGAWAGHDNAIAIWTTDNPAGNAWEFYPAAEGMIVANVFDSLLYFWNGSAWTAVGAGGGGSPNFADNETPSTWSTNHEYILAHTPNPSASLQVFIDDTTLGTYGCTKLLVQGNDYHLSGTHIVYDVSPTATNTIKCWYRY
jgi:hypothetical protein